METVKKCCNLFWKPIAWLSHNPPISIEFFFSLGQVRRKSIKLFFIFNPIDRFLLCFFLVFRLFHRVNSHIIYSTWYVNTDANWTLSPFEGCNNQWKKSFDSGSFLHCDAIFWICAWKALCMTSPIIWVLDCEWHWSIQMDFSEKKNRNFMTSSFFGFIGAFLSSLLTLIEINWKRLFIEPFVLAFSFFFWGDR